MLTRLYIDNFRCFEKFEWRPGRKQLILGRNGTGKTSLMDALVSVCQAVSGDRVDQCFKLNQRTRWLNQCEQVFEIEAQLKDGTYLYRLEIEPWGEPARPRVQFETLHCNEKLLLKFEDGKVGAHSGNGALPFTYDLDQSRSAFSTSGSRELAAFREWLRTISFWHLNPFNMASRAETDDAVPRVDLANFPAWYRHLVQAHPRETLAFLKDLRESIDGFDQFILADAGESVRTLYAEFVRDGKTVRMGFGELSEGQRCLICLYAIMHFVVAKGGTVVIDEPENFISLREIQPWLMSIEEIADDNNGQVILISHHPEILNQWAGPYGVQFIRDGAGPVRVEKFKGDSGSSLTVAELVARGWDLE
jgi:predicted ATPase